MTLIFNVVIFHLNCFSLVGRITSYSHTMLLWSRPVHWYATLWPSIGRETLICVEKLGEKYKNPAFMRDPHLPSCITLYYFAKTSKIYNGLLYRFQNMFYYADAVINYLVTFKFLVTDLFRLRIKLFIFYMVYL